MEENLEDNSLDEFLSELEVSEIKKKEKIEKEKREFLSNVVSGNIVSTRDKVGYLLNNFSDTRNSDVELAWTYWQLFESGKFNGNSITKSQLFALTRMASLIRARAKIQNEYKLFQADDIVKQHRGVLASKKREEMVEDKPANLPAYAVFMDETGKNQDFLSIGSLWIVEGGFSTYKTHSELTEWKAKNNITYEFHFTEVSRRDVDTYKEFFTKFIHLNPTAGFKIIVINNKGFSDISQTITDLSFHLIHKGIDHENSTGRAVLPRTLQIYVDEEEKGSDQLKLENLRERIAAQKINGLHLMEFEAVNSKNNHFIQIVDLFTASINRKLNAKEGEKHYKDDLADFILETLRFDISQINKSEIDSDSSVIFNLSSNKDE